MLWHVIITAIASLVLAKAIHWFVLYRKFVKTIDKIPGDKSYPIIGTAYVFWGLKRDEFFQVLNIDRFKKYPGISRVWFGFLPEVRLDLPEYVEKIVTSSVNITKSFVYELETKKWLGNGLITSTGEHWHRNRKILTPTFHFSILEGFSKTFVEQSKILLQKLLPYSDTGEPVDIFPFINHCALDIICETAMGISMNAQSSGENEYIKAVAEIATLQRIRAFNPLLHNDFIFSLTKYGARSRKTLKVLHNFVNEVIQKRKLLRNQKQEKGENEVGKKQRLAFLDLLLAEKEKRKFFSDQDIREEVDTFMFAGHDTTTISTCTALYLIGLHPDVQQKLYEEQLEIFDDPNETITTKHLSEMKYMDRVMKECLRVYPTVANVSRRLIEEIQIENYTLPVGCTATIHIWGLSRDPRYFPDPEKFDPDRFLPENVKNRHPYAFIPFSAGPRNCIGQKFAQLEEKVLLSTLLRIFKIKSVDPPESMKFVQEVVVRPINPIRLILEKRFP